MKIKNIKIPKKKWKKNDNFKYIYLIIFKKQKKFLNF